jgi:uncharacterized protein YcfJ
MDKSMITGLVIGVVVATAGASIAGYTVLGKKEPAYAEVLGVKKVTESVETPRQACEDVPVTRHKPVQDQHRIVGTVTGALLGGVLGNQIGSGKSRRIATVAGAAAGGYAGNKVQESMQANDTYTTMERRCTSVTDTHEEVTGYDVSYRLGEQQGMVRMDHDPGERIPVQKGQLVLDAGPGPATP